MKKILIWVVVIVVLGVVYWLVSPFFIDRQVSENFPTEMSTTSSELVVVQTGLFEGFDRIHYGSGTVSVIKTDEGPSIIRFEEDFNVANGPDLFVGFGRDGEYVKGTEIGKLKGNIGSQNYVLPEGFDLGDYNEVWIWCRAFSAGFARAKLVME